MTMWWMRGAVIFCCCTLVACGEPASDSAATSNTAAPAAAAPAQATLTRSQPPAGASAYIVSPSDGATVSSPVRVVFGLKGMGIVPAGIQRDDAGHHHLLIDSELPPLNLPVPADAQHVHFGGGQTETDIVLAPGSHTLQLLLGDHLHLPHDPPVVSERVTIQVQP
jgi:hypothetical protein